MKNSKKSGLRNFMKRYASYIPLLVIGLLVIPALIISQYSRIRTNTDNSNAQSSTYTVSNGEIYKNGKRVILRGVNWFGFDTPNHVTHGLWARNWKDMILQMKSLGFNAVRLPYCPASLQDSAVSSVNYEFNPDLAGKSSRQIFQLVVEELNRQQMYFLIDFHRIECGVIADRWYNANFSETDWQNSLKQVARDYGNMEYFIGIDLFNEPYGASWGDPNDVKNNWNRAADTAGQMVIQTNPNILVFVEGIESNRICSSNTAHNWGGNLEPHRCHPLQKIPKSKLVFAPHVYGPDVAYQDYFNDDRGFPGNMPQIWDTHFGFLRNEGFALAIGEWGGKYGNGGMPKDAVWQNSFANYMGNKGICNSFYWSWNPNSGDTGGILQDDWVKPWNNKLNMLYSYYKKCDPSFSPTNGYTPSFPPKPSPVPTKPLQISSSATVSPVTATAGRTVIGEVRVTPNQGVSGNVDVEIFDSTGKQVYQKFFEGQYLTDGIAKNFSFVWNTPAQLKADTYTIKVGIFDTEWQKVLSWNDNAGKVTIVAEQKDPEVVKITSTLKNTPLSVIPGNKVVMDVTVLSDQTFSTGSLIDLEVYNANGGQVFQKVMPMQLRANTPVTQRVEWNTPNTLQMNSEYRVAIGVFNENWTRLYGWNNQAGVIRVGRIAIEPTPTSALSVKARDALLYPGNEGDQFVLDHFQDALVARKTFFDDTMHSALALFPITTTVTGKYVIDATVQAPDSGRNSFFVHIDNEPYNPESIWDIQPSSQFVKRAISWRGRNVAESNYGTPQIFSLNAGNHRIYVRSRESGTFLRDITLRRVE